jgi:putative Mn2+ efflux pump MntP
MSLLELLAVALGLALDAFAVCLGVGAAGHAPGPRPALRLSFHFGLFQFLMPVLGWLAGARLLPLIVDLGHWIAFGLLVLVGVRMIHAGLRPPARSSNADPTRGMIMVMLSVAVSLDALAVGVSLAMLGVVIWQPSVIIGGVTGALSLLGIMLGNRLGARFGKPIAVAGGLVLILLGLKILLGQPGW